MICESDTTVYFNFQLYIAHNSVATFLGKHVRIFDQIVDKTNSLQTWISILISFPFKISFPMDQIDLRGK